MKPRRVAGGTGIRRFTESVPALGQQRHFFLQEFIEGESCAALYCGDGRSASLLGATRQLVGTPWLHAAPFRYCGSLGPLPLPPALRTALQRLGEVLTAGCQLRGLFGVDFVLRDGVPWPVEVNPRYTASVEILEWTLGFRALALHRRVFVADGPQPVAAAADSQVLGKAILFAQAPLTFPADGPWQAMLGLRNPLAEAPAFADIPPAGQRIEAGRPILTCFAHAASLGTCEEYLRDVAADLDRWLYRV
jgi:predicted ATP-grasp superfamily ATP-dependent carboligase